MWLCCVKICEIYPHQISAKIVQNFREITIKEATRVKMLLEICNFPQFRGSLRRNLLNDICRAGTLLFKSTEKCRTSLDAGYFLIVWSLLNSTIIYSSPLEAIWKISTLVDELLSILHFMFSKIFWNSSLSIPISKYCNGSFRKIWNLISRKIFEMGENSQNYHTVCGDSLSLFWQIFRESNGFTVPLLNI